jgi:hypothetical protein
MKKIMSFKTIVSILVLCGVSALGMPGETASTAGKTSWKVTGELGRSLFLAVGLPVLVRVPPCAHGLRRRADCLNHQGPLR